MESEGSPYIQIRKDGPFFRLAVCPADAVPPAAARPGTYASHQSAAMNAEMLHAATGFPIIDRTLRSGGEGLP